MKSSNWMPLYVADYLANTSRLTTEMHGAYLLLIMDYWQTESPLPDDDEQLAAVCRLPSAKWAKIRPVIVQFFQVEDGRWKHGRIDKEIAHAKDVSNKRRLARAGDKSTNGATIDPTIVGTNGPPLVDTANSEQLVKNLASGFTRAARAGGAPNFTDPAVRKQRWEQKVCTEISQRLPPDEAIAAINSYERGESEGKRVFNEVDRAMKAGKP